MSTKNAVKRLEAIQLSEELSSELDQEQLILSQISRKLSEGKGEKKQDNDGCWFQKC